MTTSNHESTDSSRESQEIEIAGPAFFQKGKERAHSAITMGEDDPEAGERPTQPPGIGVALSLPTTSTISSIVNFEGIEFEAAPDLSHEPVRPKDYMERTLAFDRDEDRWTTAKRYELPKVGDKVANYQIEAELGRGGFGAVYRAKNLMLGREEALKLILPSAKDECENIEKRFKREIDIVSRLEHPNIVRLYGTGVLKDNILWMTMELINGSRLDERLAQFGHFNFDRAKNLMLQFLCGLMEAHRRQIVHRDLKPANIMLSKKEGYIDQVVILDFGLSKALGSDEDTDVQELTCVDEKRIYGTPQYMAPEQINSGKLGPWTDVYAAGLIFFELITGQTAFPGDSLFDIAYKQCYEPIKFPNNLQNTAIKAVIEKACAKNPAERYNHAGEFFDALQHINHLRDPECVLSGELNGETGLNSIAMRLNNVDESEMPTQIGLSPIDSAQLAALTPETLGMASKGQEKAVPRPRFGTWFYLVAILGTIFVLAFLVLFIGWVHGDIDIRYVPHVQDTSTTPAKK